MEFRRVLFRSEQEALFLALGFFLLFARNTEDAIGNADVDVLLRKTRKFGSQAVRLFIIHHVQRGDGGETTLAKIRSEEHTSELKSLMRISYAVFCLKKKKNYIYP